jgi:glutathionylspermidine synthase
LIQIQQHSRKHKYIKMVTTSFNNYSAFAEALQRTNRISDPWVEGHERFQIAPVLLSNDTYSCLYRAAERIGALYEEFCRIVWNEPSLLDFFDLTPHERLMWFASGGAWHGIARLDLFLLHDGRVQMCEMNSDTPSGEAEAVILNSILHPAYAETLNPNAEFAQQFSAVVRAFSPQARTIGIVFPTEISEDLSMILCYEEWLLSAGFRVLKGAPYNLHISQNNGIGMFGESLDIIVRHYKTDWWAERESAWLDGDEFPDAEALQRELVLILNALQHNRCAVVNPFGSVLTQNKISMAFFHTLFHRFSESSQQTIEDYIPETKRLCDVGDISIVSNNKDNWVLKSDYGCEGDEVIIGKEITESVWIDSLSSAITTRWILQRYFDAKPTLEGYIPNYGVYLLGGSASGIYTRLSPLKTDYKSVSAATFIKGVA